MANWLKQSYTNHDLQKIMTRLIEGTEVFTHMTQADLLHLLEHADKCTFPAGETILREGSRGEYLYVLVEGAVSVRKTAAGVEEELAQLAPGDSFGEMSLVDHELRSASVIALEQCVLLRIGEGDCWRQPAVAAKLFHNIGVSLAQRLRGMNEAYLLAKPRAQTSARDKAGSEPPKQP